MSIFTDLYIRKPRRSKQVLDHSLLTTSDFGKIIPVLLEDCVPGDIFKCSTAADIKLFPTLAPLRQGIEVRIDYFFVPNRLLWNDWQNFITGGPEGTDEPVHPVINLQAQSDNVVGNLIDYFGLPPYIAEGQRGNERQLTPIAEDINALPFRAYRLIWNEYYRDQNLQDEEDIDLGSGEDLLTGTTLLYRGFKKDYFTSALPWTQRGPQVTIPIGGDAPVDGFLKFGDEDGIFRTEDQYQYSVPGMPSGGDDTLWIDSDGANYGQFKTSHNDATIEHYHDISTPSQQDWSRVSADLSEASGISINELRRLNAVQKWLERNARAGSRYIEQILSHFGVRTPDFRLDRPEYLGGNKQVIGMAEVLQTSETAGSPQGSRAGVGFGNMMAKCRKYRVDEHGLVLGLMSIIPASNMYVDGIPRMWTRNSKFDYYFPEFQNLGEQAINNKEIFGYVAGGIDPNATFGYTPRYAEYRYHPSRVTGLMRTNMAYWHMARIFNSQPNLNANFVNTSSSLEDFDRLFPTDESLGDRFIITLQHYERLKRPMQKNPNPSL